MPNLKLQFKTKGSIILFIIGIFAFLAFFLGVHKVSATELLLESKSHEIAVGEQFILNVSINTKGESVNAIEGKVVFPKGLLEVKEIRDGNSTVNFWVERPNNKEPGEIVFSGIIPGGYQGVKGFLFSIVLEAKDSGKGFIGVEDDRILLNDGKGTNAKTSISNFNFSITGDTGAASRTVESLKDTEPPESFEIKIANDPNIFDGKYFIVFSTQDKGSGIDHYEVIEGSDDKGQVAESPYLLQDQGLEKNITVKAFDKSGNERIAVLTSQKSLPWYKQILICVIIFIVWAFIARVARRIL